MLFTPGRIILGLLPMLLLVGCKAATKPQGKSPLVPARMSADSVVLELFFVRFPLGDAEVNGPLWEEIDEQHFAAERRQALARNGFRIGLISGQMPVALARLLELTDKPLPDDQINQPRAVDLDHEPTVMRRHLQIRPDRRGEIVASGTYDELPLLTCESGALSGRTYTKAQGLLAVKVTAQPDGRVRLDLTPELHHGSPRHRWVGKQGMLRLDAGRKRRVLDDLALSATLSPGNMLVLASLPDRPGSIGHYFFTEDKSGQLQQKLLVVRVSQTQHDSMFDPNEPLALEEPE